MPVEMSTTICGRLEMLSPPKESTLTTLSMVKRSTDCAAAGLADRTQTASRRARPLRTRSNDHIPGFGDDAGERAGERAHNLGMELDAGAAPQLLQCLGRGTRAAGRTASRHIVVSVTDVF